MRGWTASPIWRPRCGSSLRAWRCRKRLIGNGRRRPPLPPLQSSGAACAVELPSRRGASILPPSLAEIWGYCSWTPPSTLSAAQRSGAPCHRRRQGGCAARGAGLTGPPSTPPNRCCAARRGPWYGGRGPGGPCGPACVPGRRRLREPPLWFGPGRPGRRHRGGHRLFRGRPWRRRVGLRRRSAAPAGPTGGPVATVRVGPLGLQLGPQPSCGGPGPPKLGARDWLGNLVGAAMRKERGTRREGASSGHAEAGSRRSPEHSNFRRGGARNGQISKRLRAKRNNHKTRTPASHRLTMGVGHGASKQVHVTPQSTTTVGLPPQEQEGGDGLRHRQQRRQDHGGGHSQSIGQQRKQVPSCAHPATAADAPPKASSGAQDGVDMDAPMLGRESGAADAPEREEADDNDAAQVFDANAHATEFEKSKEAQRTRRTRDRSR